MRANWTRLFLEITGILFGILLIFAATRATIRALPGDPLETLVAESGTTIPRDILREELNLDRAFIPALWDDLSNALQGDLGRSLLTRQAIAPLLKERFKNTVILTATTILLGLSFSIFLGVLAAARPWSRWDKSCTLLGGITAALPTPWIGPIFLVTFGVWLPLFPIGGAVFLPALTLAISFVGLWSRLIRERVRESLLRGAAPGARARGVAEWKVLLKYGLAPVSGALLGYLGTHIGILLTGTFITEVVFDWRGLGSLIVDAVLRRDYTVVEASAFVTASTCLLGTYFGDKMQKVMSPQ